MKNNLCVVTFFYPGIESKIINFFNSLKKQTDKNFDLIIFFNNKKNFLLPANKIKIAVFTMNKSIISSRFEMINKLKKLDYKYFIFQDADDLMGFNRVEICRNLLKSNAVVINDLDIHGNKVFRKYFSNRIQNNTKISAMNILDYNICGMSNTSIRRTCLNKITIPLNKKIKIFDWYLWTIILSKYEAIYTNKTTTRYYVNNKSATCIPTRFNDKIKTKIMNTRKIHKKIIDKLVVNKKINNINLLIKKKIISNINFNFWWEVN